MTDNEYEKNLEILGLTSNVTRTTLEEAYSKLLEVHNPDLFNDSENKERAIRNRELATKAYQYLLDYMKQNGNSMEIIMRESLPQSVLEQLLPNENVYYFSYITFKGGCGSNETTETEYYWIALTEKRILYKTQVLLTDDGNYGLMVKNGVIPFENISSIEVVEVKDIISGQSFQLHINTSGSSIIIPILTETKGFEIRKAYMELLELNKQ